MIRLTCFFVLAPFILSDNEIVVSSNDSIPGSNKCILPPYPAHGSYSVGGKPDAEPGEAFPEVLLTYTCDYGYYGGDDTLFLYCQDGSWFGGFPECLPHCRLRTHPSMEYNCLIDSSGNETRPCKLYEPVGTVIRPTCKPNYSRIRPLSLMRCTKNGYDSYESCPPVRFPVSNNVMENVECRDDQWKCSDGSCIFSAEKCDLIENCADGSDEAYVLCNEDTDISKVCILPPFPANGTYTVNNHRTATPGHGYTEVVLNYTCSEGFKLRGKNQIFCSKGTWSDRFLKCVEICADGSDECDDRPVLSSSGKCILPPYPTQGVYTMKDNIKAGPGQRYQTALLNYACNIGYGLLNSAGQVFCYNGTWSGEFPQCVRLCRLEKHVSVEYRCRVPEVDGFRECNLDEPLGTVVYPNCKTPHYYYSGVLSTMRCLETGWDSYPVCLPECGRLTPGGIELIIDGRKAQRGEVPWHAGIYRTTTKPFMQICGGSLVSTSLVISAAHCFWNDVDKKLPASRYAVAVGKIYRPWNSPNDTDVQKSEVKEIVIPSRFRGAATNFQDDIALVVLKESIHYEVHIRPICLDFDHEIERLQLRVGQLAKVAGWGLTGANGDPSPILQVAEIPYVDIDDCIDHSPHEFRELITSDKICAGYRNGTALCKGDSGGGLAFPESDKGVERYYLRGIVSTAPRNDDKCTQFTLTTFTQVSRHEYYKVYKYFIKEYL